MSDRVAVIGTLKHSEWPGWIVRLFVCGHGEVIAIDEPTLWRTKFNTICRLCSSPREKRGW